MSFDFDPPAEEEMLRAARYYADVATERLSRRFLRRVLEAGDFLAENPRAGRPIPHGMRSWKIAEFPYRLVYAVEEGKITVYQVSHCSRR